MSDEFFVDADGLTSSSSGFTQKAGELHNLAQRIHDLAQPGRVLAATGDDKNGKNFANVHLEAVGKIFTGVDAWAKAVDGTAGAVRDTADSFRDVDEAATRAASQLWTAFSQLNVDAGGGAGTPLQPETFHPLERQTPQKPAK
ncbi:hypothetical protein [Amycolatopsis sp. FDAARGOS 1241]|uniref:hypothetical protein n=1 Tax=Amycolatopsis sp. FDAARGOS 1241 TaxID=2778070 RepID=UPI00194E9672|nr:hypothetical protein [Amycolatopsis sp. FDAARGOS 1241]QRP46400.1 hypothetical protein I6J71_46610 [Amycolatopsis sp. FDAARGOS 1241]